MKLFRRDRQRVARHSVEPLIRQTNAVIRDLDQTVDRLERYTEYLQMKLHGTPARLEGDEAHVFPA